MNSHGRDRISGHEDLEILIDFGSVPVGGIYGRSRDEIPDVCFPLVVCHSAGSGLVQLRDPYDPGRYEDYSFSGFSSETYHGHLVSLADQLKSEIGPGATVFEIGASDGAFLEELSQRGFDGFGVEPSRRLVSGALQRGTNVVQGYVTPESARNYRGKSRGFDLVVMRHVLEHLDQPRAMFASIEELVSSDGVLLLELPDYAGILEQKAYSSFFHEHVAYYSSEVLWSLLAEFGWGVQSYSRPSIHGASHRAMCRKGEHLVQPTPIPAHLEEAFFGGLEEFKLTFRSLVAGIVATGDRIAGYGASHRTANLLALGGLLDVDLTAIYDSNRLLWGLFQPPSGVPIADPSSISVNDCDVIIVFATSYEYEIVNQLSPFTTDGGKLLLLGDGRPRIFP